MCFVFIWEQTATCATYSINWLVFITKMKSVYCAVRAGTLNKAVCALSLKGYHCSICYITAIKYFPRVLHSTFLYPQNDKRYSCKYTLSRLKQHFIIFSSLHVSVEIDHHQAFSTKPKKKIVICEISETLHNMYVVFVENAWWWSLSIETYIGKAIPLQAWTGPEGFRRLSLPDFKTIGTWRW